MIVLHVAAVDDDLSSGVSVVVPEHVKNQSLIERHTALLNCSTSTRRLTAHCFGKECCEDGNIRKLPEPFNKPDIVIFHGVYFWYFIKVSKHLIEDNIPYVIIPHGSLTSFAQNKKRLKKSLANIVLFRRFINNAISIQYLTNEEQKQSSRFRKSYFICGNGIYPKHPEVYRSADTEVGYQFTFIGRLDPFHKGLDKLLDACHMIEGDMRRSNMHLSIYGPDYQNGAIKLKTLCDKFGLCDIVSVNGPVYGKYKDDILKRTDVFVLTSRFEGQPLAVLESLAMGVPVLITPGTNLSNVVEKYNCGWVADFSTQSIAQMMLNSYNVRLENHTLSRNAINLIDSSYSWSKIAQKNIQAFRDLIQKN